MVTLPRMPMAQDRCPLKQAPLRTKVYGTNCASIISPNSIKPHLVEVNN